MKKIADPSGREGIQTLKRNERLRLILEILHHTKEGTDLHGRHGRLLSVAITAPSAVLDAQVRALHHRVLDGSYRRKKRL